MLLWKRTHIHEIGSTCPSFSYTSSKARYKHTRGHEAKLVALQLCWHHVMMFMSSPPAPHPTLGPRRVLGRKPHERNSFPATRLEPRSFACCPARVNQQPSTPCAPARFKHAQPEAPMAAKKGLLYVESRKKKKQTRSRLVSHRQENRNVRKPLDKNAELLEIVLQFAASL